MKFLCFLILILTIFSCKDKKDQSSNRENWSHHDLKTKQYLIEGKKLYAIHCTNCHLDDGKGIMRLVPPLAQSDFMISDIERTVCIIKNGVDGEMIVNDTAYNHPMPGFKNLSDIEIAEISTYIYNSWGHNKGIITIPQVKQALKNCEQ